MIVPSSSTKGFFVADFPLAYAVDSIRFRGLIKKLNELFGIDRIDGFRGSYTLPRDVSIAEIEPRRAELSLAGLPTQTPTNNFSFDLLTENLSKVRWWLTGPLNRDQNARYSQGKVTVVNSAGATYRISEKGLEAQDHHTGKRTLLMVPANFPAFSWPTDLAYDSFREVISIVTLGGEGFLYRYDVKRGQWLDFRSLNNVDIASFAFDELAKRYVAWTTEARLIFISDSGEVLFSKSLIDFLPELGATYDRGNDGPPRLTLVPRGNDVALVYAPNGPVEKIWTYDISKGAAQLTYKASQ